MIRIKSFSQFPLAHSLGGLLAQRLKRVLQDDHPDVVLSVPKFWLKRLVTGANSSEALGESVAANLQLKYFAKAVCWMRNISKQSLLSATERRQNVRGALELADGYQFQDAHVLLVDDTMTTGSTANEASRVLKNSGARKISVAILGRAFSG